MRGSFDIYNAWLNNSYKGREFVLFTDLRESIYNDIRSYGRCELVEAILSDNAEYNNIVLLAIYDVIKAYRENKGLKHRNANRVLYEGERIQVSMPWKNFAKIKGELAIELFCYCSRNYGLPKNLSTESEVCKYTSEEIECEAQTETTFIDDGGHSFDDNLDIVNNGYTTDCVEYTTNTESANEIIEKANAYAAKIIAEAEKQAADIRNAAEAQKLDILAVARSRGEEIERDAENKRDVIINSAYNQKAQIVDNANNESEIIRRNANAEKERIIQCNADEKVHQLVKERLAHYINNIQNEAADHRIKMADLQRDIANENNTIKGTVFDGITELREALTDVMSKTVKSFEDEMMSKVYGWQKNIYVGEFYGFVSCYANFMILLKKMDDEIQEISEKNDEISQSVGASLEQFYNRFNQFSNQFKRALIRAGITEIIPEEGEKFDSYYHTHIDNTSGEADEDAYDSYPISRCVVPGYMMIRGNDETPILRAVVDTKPK